MGHPSAVGDIKKKFDHEKDLGLYVHDAKSIGLNLLSYYSDRVPVINIYQSIFRSYLWNASYEL